MQNSKLQTLWQLTQELKDKRQDLLEKLNTQQHYLDQQQSAIGAELGSLRNNVDGLAEDHQTLLAQLQALAEQIQNQESGPVADPNKVSMDPRFLDILGKFAVLNGEAGGLQQLITQASDEVQSTFQDLLNQLAEWTQFFQGGHQGHLTGESDSAQDEETLSESQGFLAGYVQAWTEAKTSLAADLGSAAVPAEPSENVDAVRAEYESQIESLNATLNGKILELGNLEATQAQQNEEHQQALDRVGNITQEFSELKESNNELASDLKHLEEQTHKLIELAETFRQAALAAMDDGEEEEEEETASEATEAVADDDGANSKAEVIRDTLRKKIAIVLRQRFGKAPRKVTNALKELSNNKEMDRLFELSISCEDLETYEAEFAD